jgi:hypothetical protein
MGKGKKPCRDIAFLRIFCQIWYQVFTFGIHNNNLLYSKIVSLDPNYKIGVLGLYIYVPQWHSIPVIHQAPYSILSHPMIRIAAMEIL